MTIAAAGFEAEFFENNSGKIVFFKVNWYLVDGFDVGGGDDVFFGDVAEGGDFFFAGFVQRGGRAGDDDVRLDAGGIQQAGGVLGGFCFHLANHFGSGKVAD